VVSNTIGNGVIVFSIVEYSGSDMNPAWSQADDRNVHAIVAFFGFHLILHMFTIPLCYLAIYFLLWAVKREGRNQFKPLLNKIDDTDTA
jgi:hypothetical protein